MLTFRVFIAEPQPEDQVPAQAGLATGRPSGVGFSLFEPPAPTSNDLPKVLHPRVQRWYRRMLCALWWRSEQTGLVWRYGHL